LMFIAAAVASSSSNSSTLSQVEPGLLGFLIVAGLAVILFFLLRNMNKQFKKLGPPPDDTEAESAAGEAGTPVKVVRAITAGTATVETGDAAQDAKAEGGTKRK
jgi:membrane protein implicated in regulation of membrane protease activity